MKKSALLLPILLLAVACASKDGFIDQVAMECEPGQEVTIQAGLDTPSMQMERIDDQLTLLVEVSNNSHRELVVTFIRAQQVPDDMQRYRLQNGYRKVDQPIEEGKSHLFKIPMTGRVAGVSSESLGRANPQIGLDVTVGLTNGNVYHCRFGVRAPL
jgi:hypothetical protein